MHSHIGYFIKTINDRIKVNADAGLKSQNLTLAQSRVLLYLYEQGGKTTQKEIEEYLEVSHPTVVGIVSRLEGNGFLKTWFDADDRRNKVVCLTESASSICKDMDNVIQEVEKKMLNSLSDKQVEQLTEMLSLIYQNLD